MALQSQSSDLANSSDVDSKSASFAPTVTARFVAPTTDCHCNTFSRSTNNKLPIVHSRRPHHNPMAFSLPAPLPAPIARSRLKSNLGALALFAFLRAIFTPYISLRAVLVALLDKVLALASLQRRGSAMVWWIGESCGGQRAAWICPASLLIAASRAAR